MELLYMKDCYVREFDATVVGVGEGYALLDRTAFYPEGGGQPCDTGSLNGVRVSSVKKGADGVRHYADAPLSGAVHGVLDWPRRHAHMRMHTAQHLLSAIALDKYGAETTGNQIGAERSRMDFNLERIDEGMLSYLTGEFNRAADEKRAVRVYTAPRQDVMDNIEPRRRKLFERVPPTVEEVRVVEIEGIDKCPCAGTHVANTGEIGHIEIVAVENKGVGRRRLVFTLKI